MTATPQGPPDRAAKLAEIREADGYPERTYGWRCKLNPQERALRDAIRIIDEMARENAKLKQELAYLYGGESNTQIIKEADRLFDKHLEREKADARLGAALRPHLETLREMCSQQWTSSHEVARLFDALTPFLAPLIEQAQDAK